MTRVKMKNIPIPVNITPISLNTMPQIEAINAISNKLISRTIKYLRDELTQTFPLYLDYDALRIQQKLSSDPKTPSLL